MEKVDIFALKPFDGRTENMLVCSQLDANGQNTDQIIPGVQIEGQYKCDAGYLLITNYDCPYQETDEFVLLNQHFEMIDRNWLGFFSPLIFRHWPISDTAIRIHYYDDTYYTASVEHQEGSKPKVILTPFEDVELDPEAVASREAFIQRKRDWDAYEAQKGLPSPQEQ